MGAVLDGTGWAIRDWPMIEVPRELVWDHAEAPADELWRPQRVADFFPRHGRDRASAGALHARRDALRLPPEVRELIELYERLWRERIDGLTS